MIRIWKGKQCVHYIVALSSVYTKHVSVNVDELQIMRRCLAYRARSQGCVLFDSWRFFKILGDRYLWIPKVGSFWSSSSGKVCDANKWLPISNLEVLRVQRSLKFRRNSDFEAIQRRNKFRTSSFDP